MTRGTNIVTTSRRFLLRQMGLAQLIMLVTASVTFGQEPSWGGGFAPAAPMPHYYGRGCASGSCGTARTWLPAPVLSAPATYERPMQGVPANRAGQSMIGTTRPVFQLAPSPQELANQLAANRESPYYTYQDRKSLTGGPISSPPPAAAPENDSPFYP